MSFYLRPFQPDALSEGSAEDRIAHLIAEFKRNRDGFMKSAQEESRYWKNRFTEYEKRFSHEDGPGHINSLGELQGNVDRFDLITVQLSMVDNIIKHLEAGPEEPQIELPTRPRRRPAARKDKK